MPKYSFNNIEFEMPNSWQVNEIGDMIELVDPQEQGALHLSFLKKTHAGVPNQSEAKLLVENFASNNDLVAGDSIEIEGDSFEIKALGSFRPKTPTDDTPLYWLVGCIVWQEKAVRISFCTDNAELFGPAKETIESITLASSPSIH